MKNKFKFLGIILIIAVIGFFVACGDDEPEPDPVPVEQSKTFSNIATENGTVNVTVTYTALPDTTPGYVSLIEVAVKGVLPYYDGTGNFTINVMVGDNGFTVTDPKTLSVGESWFTGKTQDDVIDAMILVVNAWGFQ